MISQVIATMLFLVIVSITGESEDAYYKYAVLFTGLSGLLVMPPMIFFYKKDKVRRMIGGLIPEPKGDSINVIEGIWLLFMGAAFSMFGNLLMAMMQGVFDYSAYEESMNMITDGKSLFVLILWMGIVAPIAEEMIFRWIVFLRLRDTMRFASAAIVSGLIFGIYHGNILQAIYASVLGTIFAYILEKSGNIWSCVLLHMGANVWSLVYQAAAVYMIENDALISEGILLLILGVLFVLMITGVIYFDRKGIIRKTRRV